jgi:oxygen-independent coproporphyrinogen-3 oxidase
MQPALVQAMALELQLQQNYLAGARLETLYLGGGTPSLLSLSQLSYLLNTVHRCFSIAPNAEITLECNPDDITLEYLTGLHAMGINRLSMGIQTFDDRLLHSLNRLHTSQQSLQAVQLAQDLGITNLSIDLMYALPGGNEAQWEKDLQQALSLQVPHVSAYCLTIEAGTAFGVWQQKGRLLAAEEERTAREFERLMACMETAGYAHYEISNFSIPGFYSQHNTAYWQGTPYLGIGPSAHSYNGHSRQWNLAHNAAYLKALNAGQLPATLEALSPVDKLNEYVMTSLRTMWGLDLEKAQVLSGNAFLATHQQTLNQYLQSGMLLSESPRIRLSPKGKLLADAITADLFTTPESTLT